MRPRTGAVEADALAEEGFRKEAERLVACFEEEKEGEILVMRGLGLM
jgi:hypothetical protein